MAYRCWFLALRHGDTARITNLAYLTPFLSLVYLRVLVGEEILFSSLAGLLVILAGVFLQFAGGRPRGQ